MAKTLNLKKPDAAKHCTTLGELERLAGIGASFDDRFAFWQQFSHLGEGAFNAARAELYRRIEALPAEGEIVPLIQPDKPTTPKAQEAHT